VQQRRRDLLVTTKGAGPQENATVCTSCSCTRFPFRMCRFLEQLPGFPSRLCDFWSRGSAHYQWQERRRVMALSCARKGKEQSNFHTYLIPPACFVFARTTRSLCFFPARARPLPLTFSVHARLPPTRPAMPSTDFSRVRTAYTPPSA
jgi:hypothetical protein